MLFFRRKKKTNTETNLTSDRKSTSELKPEDVLRQMLANASACMQAKQYVKAADTYRAILKLEQNAEAMNWLGVLYNAGAGVEKNDLAALYWFDKATDAGYEVSRKDRNGILRFYVNRYGRSGIGTVTEEISKACEAGTDAIPKDLEKAKYWHEKGKKIAGSKPILSQYVTYGVRKGENAEIILQDTELDYSKVLVDEKGVIQNFPGIEQGSWTKYIEGDFNFDSGIIEFRSVVDDREEGGFRMLWQVQPDGRYWADSGGFGAEPDVELILYADLNDTGDFTGPFRIYKIDGNRVEEKPQEKKSAPLPLEELTVKVMEFFMKKMREEMPKTGAFRPISVSYMIPGTANAAVFQIESISTEPDKRIFKVFVVRRGEDRAYNHFFKSGENAVIWEYFENKAVVNEIVESVRELSKSVDDYY